MGDWGIIEAQIAYIALGIEAHRHIIMGSPRMEGG